MLSRFDRVQMVVQDRTEMAARWANLMDAEVASEDKAPHLGARRTTLAVGTSEVELLEADGEGLVAEFNRSRRGLGPFGAGFQAPDVDVVRARFDRDGVAYEADGPRLQVEGAALGLPALRLTIAPEIDRPRVGLMERLYEVTYLVGDADAACAQFARRFALDRGVFCPIESSSYGYRGELTLLAPDALDRVEIIDPHDTSKTMGRFFARHAESLYMCYAETDRSAEVRERALEHAPDGWTGTRDEPVPDGLFLHHTALGGMMMGVSRTTYAWSWSGHPEWIAPLR